MTGLCNWLHRPPVLLASNLQSASQQPEVIDATLKEECSAGQIFGPFDKPHFCTSGVGLVPKHNGG